jgi:hypothetical protein
MEDRSVYQWFVFIHLIGLVVFLLAHGASAFISLRLPAQRDPVVVANDLETSKIATRTMYVGLVLLLIGGAGAATINEFWSKPWVLGSIVVLVVVIGAMYALGTGYYNALRQKLAANAGRPMAEDVLVGLLDPQRPRILAGVGVLGLLLIIWLMVLKPGG